MALDLSNFDRQTWFTTGPVPGIDQRTARQAALFILNHNTVEQSRIIMDALGITTVLRDAP